LLCEGTVANSNEQLHRFPAVDGADTTDEIVLDSAAQALTNKTIEGASNDLQLRRHATDCTGLADGVAGEPCYEQDADSLYICEPASGGCDTAGEWRQVGGAGGGGDSTKTHYIPLQCHTPQASANQGNAFWTISALTAWDAGHWQFLNDVVGKIFCQVRIPHTLAGTPAARIVLALAANATSGVATLSVATRAVADGESLNPASLADEADIDVAVPGTARLRKDVTFPVSGVLSETVGAGELLLVEIQHVGTAANDTLAVNAELHGAWLQVDLTE
jgi:hypothetical protein